MIRNWFLVFFSVVLSTCIASVTSVQDTTNGRCSSTLGFDFCSEIDHVSSYESDVISLELVVFEIGARLECLTY